MDMEERLQHEVKPRDGIPKFPAIPGRILSGSIMIQERGGKKKKKKKDPDISDET